MSRSDDAGTRPPFVKHRPGAPEGFFASEAAGLAWLGEPGAVPVPGVLSVTGDTITMERIEPGRPSAKGAQRFGRALAAVHAAGSDQFGAPWPGFIGPLPMSNEPLGTWAPFYVERRLLPYLRLARDRGSLTAQGVRRIERVTEVMDQVSGPPEGPSRIHGDLWSGNVLWSRDDQAWLIDPAAHGGHRETDLAMLALFGAPFLDHILGAYRDHHPLAPGWRERAPLHQLHPLLVHAVLFGSGYGDQAAQAAQRLLADHGGAAGRGQTGPTSRRF